METSQRKRAKDTARRAQIPAVQLLGGGLDRKETGKIGHDAASAHNLHTHFKKYGLRVEPDQLWLMLPLMGRAVNLLPGQTHPHMKNALCLLLLALVAIAPTALAQDAKTISEFVEDFDAKPGFISIYHDRSEDKVYLKVEETSVDLLHFVSLPRGLGSNDVGLDRGLLGPERVVRFEQHGKKLLLIQPNLSFRATSDNPAERKAVRDAFAESVLWGFKIVAAEDGAVLVDATDFLLSDGMAVSTRLSRQNQGTFSLDKSRSAFDASGSKAFPDNTELESIVTFTSNNPGRFVRDVAANPSAVTMTFRYSFVRLPDLGTYTPREMHPRSGFFGVAYVDYATPIGERKEKRLLVRHKLEKTDPGAERSTVKEPIVYYLDAGTPEPVRSALLDGARWWADAFEAAGFIDAYRVEMMPPGADPLDVRYNVIQWVHRATRGWSYGNAVTDPRTGQILKGHVSLGSLRVRQDYLIAEGLLAPYGEKDFGAGDADPMLDLSLARIRQLSAHEIGHTIGLAHNFAASTNNRASVMDYPAPLATVTVAGDIDISQAYDSGIGEWDKVAVAYGYTEFGSVDEEIAGLRAILDRAEAEGLRYITDQDARPLGGIHPAAHLWDNGTHPVEALENEMDVRRVALQNFGKNVVESTRPLSLIEEALVPLYLRHRFQIEAVAKLVGGVDYSYGMRDEDVSAQVLPVTEQRRAADALISLLTPPDLAIPETVRELVLPRPPGYPANRELFDRYTGMSFDMVAPAEVVTEMVLTALLHPQRAARLIQQHDFDEDQMGFRELLNRTTRQLFPISAASSAYEAELQRTVQQVYVETLMSLAQSKSSWPAVHARAHSQLEQISVLLDESSTQDEEAIAHRSYLSGLIERFLFRQYDAEEMRESITAPPGSPIGSGERAAARGEFIEAIRKADILCGWEYSE